MNDAFIAFWSGMAGGFVLGIATAAIFKVIGDSIEREEDNT